MINLAAIQALGRHLDPFWVIACIVGTSGVIMLAFEFGRYRGYVDYKRRKR